MANWGTKKRTLSGESWMTSKLSYWIKKNLKPKKVNKIIAMISKNLIKKTSKSNRDKAKMMTKTDLIQTYYKSNFLNHKATKAKTAFLSSVPPATTLPRTSPP